MRSRQSGLRYDLEASRRAIPRVVTLAAAIVFALLGAMALLFVMTTDVPATSSGDSRVEVEETARRFYAAINDAISTGDLSLLADLPVDPDSAWCKLHCRVAALHQLAPEIRVEIDELLIDGDRVAARLSLHGNVRPVFLGLPLAGNLSPWGSVDFLRIEGGRVVAVQPASDRPALIEPLARTAVDSVPNAPFRLGLVRLTLEPGAALPDLTAIGPGMLLIEHGNVIAQTDTVALVQRRGGEPRSRPAESAYGPIPATSGDQITIEAGTGYSLRNPGNETAVILAAAMLDGDGGITNRWLRARPLHEIVFSPLGSETADQAVEPISWPPGVRSALLAEGAIAARPGASATLELNRLTLQPSAELPVHHITGGEIVVVDDGAAVVDLVGGAGAIRSQSDTVLSRIWPHGGSSAQDPTISRGGSAVLQPESFAGVRDQGDGSLTLLILSLEPEPAPS